MLHLLRKKKGVVKRKRRRVKESHPLRFQLVVGVLLFTLIGTLIAGVWYGTRIESLQIKDISVVGGQTIPHQELADRASEELSGAYFRIIPKRFIWFYPKDEIVRSLSAVDRVKNVHIEVTDDDTLAIAFDEYRPYALWCERSDERQCLFMDESGYAFAIAPELYGSAFVRYVEENVVPEVGATAFDTAFMTQTSAFIDALLEELSLYVTHVEKIGDYDIQYRVSGGGTIKVSQTISATETFNNLKTILESDSFEHLEPGAFQYIDLRFGDKVFINEELSTDETASSTVQNP